MTTKRCIKCLEEKPLDAFTNRKDSKDGKRNSCTACKSKQNLEWTHAVKSTPQGREDFLRKKRDNAKNNAENKREYSRKYHQLNKNNEKYRYRRRICTGEYLSGRRGATPSWANKKLMQEFYITAHGLSMLLGEFYQVDHIVPLNSPLVCGLHCEANLRVITRSDNTTKGNRYWDGMPD